MIKSKEEAIFLCLSEPDIDLWRLRELALTEGGLLHDSIRRKAWPKLLGIAFSSDMQGTSERFQPNGSGIPAEAEMDQVDRDVTRCSWHLITYEQRRQLDAYGSQGSHTEQSKQVAAVLRRKQRRLGHLINMILQDGCGELNYYQGFHDVSSIFLSALGDEGLTYTKIVLQKLTESHFRDAMRENFSKIISALRLVFLPLIATLDPQMHSYLLESGVEPFFALSWVLTWFSHDIKDTRVATRLFDAFLVSHPLLPVYLSVAMVLHRVNRRIVFNTECDFAEMHNALCHLPKNTCSIGWREDGYVLNDELDQNRSDSEVPVQDLIQMAISFMRQIPPRKLPLLAKKYCGGVLRPLMTNISSITLLQPPPSWALMGTIPSDWVSKQQARVRKGLPCKNKKEEKTWNQALRKLTVLSNSDQVNVKFELSNLSKNNNNAMAASGEGPYGDDDRRMKILIWTGIAVAVLSIAWALSSTGKLNFGSGNFQQKGVLVDDQAGSCQVEEIPFEPIDDRVCTGAVMRNGVVGLPKGEPVQLSRGKLKWIRSSVRNVRDIFSGQAIHALL
mmetsp:Transcript_24791/g.36371  ORF Transcript_24791/g.36371 Transcript_24791/m.36371 type:complete len:560 (-) Transcript_24791:990-2669(-)|eukprot:CAMPEP_0195511712 /NCGR_PEP_ID=MMETSP0794_2-20130614/3939_1 /TAXON_ID=515487 /ORGANISM="Stephanopyxis turris, Strain CCMP 815" /LENGTH=559 /DNA_ID=CAMNT_0040639365 /DNA_START=131 /DNA_END=1810 /DNA_ORIENTATION=+